MFQVRQAKITSTDLRPMRGVVSARVEMWITLEDDIPEFRWTERVAIPFDPLIPRPERCDRLVAEAIDQARRYFDGEDREAEHLFQDLPTGLTATDEMALARELSDIEDGFHDAA